jgi:negative regulator of sigma E activity
MSIQPDEQNELLSGLLDGALTDDERARIEAAMKADPSIDGRLEELFALRRSLLRGRRVGHLGPDFASRIVASAKARASEMGDEAPAWLQESNIPRRESIAPIPEISASDRAIKVWIPAVVCTAAASVAIFLFSTANRQNPNALVGNIPRVVEQTPSDEDPNRDANDIIADVLRSESGDSKVAQSPMDPAEEKLGVGPLGVELSNQIASQEHDQDTNTMLEPSAVFAPKLPPANTPVPTDVAKIAEANPVDSNKPSVLVPGLKGLKDMKFTAVVDISIDPVAQANDALRTLLDKYDIAHAEDLALDPAQVDTLITSQVVGPRVDDAATEEAVLVWFIRGDGRRIDSLIEEIEANYQDFPKYRWNMAVDPNVNKLMDQLASVDQEPKSSSSHRLAMRGPGDGLISSFPGVDRGTSQTIEQRMQASEAKRSKPRIDLNPRSNLLLIVRPMSD